MNYLVSVSLILLSQILLAKNIKIEGIAKDLKTGKVVYTEIHEVTLDNKQQNQTIQTKYYAPNKELFAELTSDFSKSKYIPNVIFHDLRNIKKFSKVLNDQKEISIESEIQNKKSQKSIKINKELTVSGQGFDNFLKDHFNMKSPLEIDFLVLEKKKLYGFIVEKKDLSPTLTQFSLKLDSFLKYFTMPVEVTYDTETQFLKKYKGLSNITDHEDKTLIVEIDYTRLDTK